MGRQKMLMDLEQKLLLLSLEESIYLSVIVDRCLVDSQSYKVKESSKFKIKTLG